MIILTVVFVFGLAYAAFGQAPPKAYFEIRTVAAGYGDPPFPFTSLVTAYDHVVPPTVYFSSHYAIWACEPIAHKDYDVYAVQDTVNPDPDWESETDHAIIINAAVDFFHQYMIRNTFQPAGD